jgi:hypothetical protein
MFSFCFIRNHRGGHAADIHQGNIERRRRQILRQRRKIKRAGIPTKSTEELLARMLSKVDELCAERDGLVGECRIAKRA